MMSIVPLVVVLLLLAVAVLRGASYLPTSWALEDLDPVVVVAGQVAIAALAAAALLAVRPASRRAAAVLARERPLAVLVLGLTQTAAPLLLVAVALRTVPTGLTAVLIAATPLFVAAIGLAGGGQRLGGGAAVGLLLGLLGVALVVGLGSQGLQVDLLGGLAALGAAVAYAAGALVVRRWFVTEPPLATGALAVLGAVPFVALAVPVALASGATVAPGGRAILALLLLGVLAVLLAVVLFVALVQRAGPQRALLVTYLNPAVALALGAIAEGEQITARAVAGLVLILLGVTLGARGGRPPRTAATGLAAEATEPGGPASSARVATVDP